MLSVKACATLHINTLLLTWRSRADVRPAGCMPGSIDMPVPDLYTASELAPAGEQAHSRTQAKTWTLDVGIPYTTGVCSLPETLQRIMNRAREERLPLVYFGLGSMLSVMFEARTASAGRAYGCPPQKWAVITTQPDLSSAA